ncbi:hypothetical protein CDCA_CDCA06G1869 [Cyanidium caldarium]|uniref:Uncharacterized protein n=1 Tax=Cyanidium caldarium TaxID=2771 RepID=A0AAV9IUA0_CYACA|nr:hypothetical protein CDCA_CDCA06G1869 [Cyanidium caldarium]
MDEILLREEFLPLAVETRSAAARREALARLQAYIDCNTVSSASLEMVGEALLDCVLVEVECAERVGQRGTRGRRGRRNGAQRAHNALVLLARLVAYYARSRDGNVDDVVRGERRRRMLAWLSGRLPTLIEAVVVDGSEAVALSVLPPPRMAAKALRDRLLALVCVWREQLAAEEATFEAAYRLVTESLQAAVPANPQAVLRPRHYRQLQTWRQSLLPRAEMILMQMAATDAEGAPPYAYRAELERAEQALIQANAVAGALRDDDNEGATAMRDMWREVWEYARALERRYRVVRRWHRELREVCAAWANVENARPPAPAAEDVNLTRAQRARDELEAWLQRAERALTQLTEWKRQLDCSESAKAGVSPRRPTTHTGLALDDRDTEDASANDTDAYDEVEFVEAPETGDGDPTVDSAGGMPDIVAADAPPTSAPPTAYVPLEGDRAGAVRFVDAARINRESKARVRVFLSEKRRQGDTLNESILQALEASEAAITTPTARPEPPSWQEDPLRGFAPRDLQPASYSQTAAKTRRHPRVRRFVREAYGRAMRSAVQRTEEEWGARHRDRHA